MKDSRHIKFGKTTNLSEFIAFTHSPIRKNDSYDAKILITQTLFKKKQFLSFVKHPD